MLKSKCIICNKTYNIQEDGKNGVDYTHGLCPECFEKRKLKKKSGKLIYRFKKSDQKK